MRRSRSLVSVIHVLPPPFRPGVCPGGMGCRRRRSPRRTPGRGAAQRRSPRAKRREHRGLGEVFRAPGGEVHPRGEGRRPPISPAQVRPGPRDSQGDEDRARVRAERRPLRRASPTSSGRDRKGLTLTWKPKKRAAVNEYLLLNTICVSKSQTPAVQKIIKAKHQAVPLRRTRPGKYTTSTTDPGRHARGRGEGEGGDLRPLPDHHREAHGRRKRVQGEDGQGQEGGRARLRRDPRRRQVHRIHRRVAEQAGCGPEGDRRLPGERGRGSSRSPRAR